MDTPRKIRKPYERKAPRPSKPRNMASREEPPYMTMKELELFMNHVATRVSTGFDNTKYLCLYMLAYEFALRREETRILEIDDYDRDRGMLKITRVKNGLSPRYYPISVNTRKILDRWLVKRHEVYGIPKESGYIFPARDGRMLHYKTYANMAISLFAEIGLSHRGYHFHTFRHTRGTQMAEAGVDIRIIQDWLGHKAITSTAIYVQIAEKTRKEIPGRMKNYTPKIQNPPAC